MTQGFLRASPGHPEVIKLEAEMQAEYVEMYGEPDQDPDNHKNQTEEMILAHVDGDPAGIAGWKRWPSGEGKVCLVYVTPRHRRKGLALEMLIRMEEAMKAKGLHAVKFESGPKQEPAHRMYDNHGYRRVAGFGFYRDAEGSEFFRKEL